MAREQIPQGFDIGTFTTTAVQLSATEKLVTSFIVQAPITNTDFIKIGNAAGQFFNIAPGKDFEVNGDNLDNGTTAYTDLAKWYVIAVSGNQDANVVYLERY